MPVSLRISAYILVWMSLRSKLSAIREDPPLQFRVFITSLRSAKYNMPVDWRPDKPLRDFIKDNSHSLQIKQWGRYEGRVFNVKGHIMEQTIRNNQRDLHEIEGSLEVQRQLLLKLAEQENQTMEKPERCTSSVERLGCLRTDTVQAIQKTWNQSSRYSAKKRSLYPLW
jgi:hypothetical protein